jgi:outer membrane receptor protein involved in Fe transport
MEGSRSPAVLAPVVRAWNAVMVAVFMIPTAASAQLELGELRGRVLDPQGGLLPGAQVVLLDERGAALRTVASDAVGRFVFKGVAPGSYYLKASSAPLVSPLRSVVVGNALTVELDLRLAARSGETVVVTAGPELPALATRTSLSGESVRQVPARLAGLGLRVAVATTAGWATEDNGIIHVRGVDDGFLFVIDGVPLYERFDVLFGIAPEPAVVSSLNVITGHLPAEFGLKAGGVIEVNTDASLRRSWSGALEAALGSEQNEGANGQVAGPLADHAALALYASGERSDRFLDPVHPDNFHNQGSAYQGDARLVVLPSSRDSLTLGMRYGSSTFDVPNNETQEEAAQDARQGLTHALPLVSWQRNWSAHTVTQVALLGSFTDSDLRPSPNDVPLSTTARRTGERLGLLSSVTRGLDRHVFKGGLELSRVRIDEAFAFHVTDAAEAEEAELSQAALQFDAAHPFVFTGKRSGVQLSGYVQDTWTAFPGLVLNLGVRFDRSALFRPETSFGPRVGLAYRPTPRTALRASVNRYFQPPQPEWLLLASSEQARVLSPFAAEGLAGGAIPRAERQTGLEVGWEQWLGRAVRLDLALWHRRATNVSDPNLFFGTTIIFPNSVAEGRAKGLDLRLDVPRRGGFGGYLGYTLSKVDQYGPITGGLFIEESSLEIGPGTRFTPDHDQRHVGVLGISYERERFWLQAAARYESGTPVEVNAANLPTLRQRPGVDRVDLGRGRVKPRGVLDIAVGLRLLRLGPLAVEAQLDAVNVLNAAYAFNFGNPFSGTHFGPPRALVLKLRLCSAGSGAKPGSAAESAGRMGGPLSE